MSLDLIASSSGAPCVRIVVASISTQVHTGDMAYSVDLH